MQALRHYNHAYDDGAVPIMFASLVVALATSASARRYGSKAWKRDWEEWKNFSTDCITLTFLIDQMIDGASHVKFEVWLRDGLHTIEFIRAVQGHSGNVVDPEV